VKAYMPWEVNHAVTLRLKDGASAWESEVDSVVFARYENLSRVARRSAPVCREGWPPVPRYMRSAWYEDCARPSAARREAEVHASSQQVPSAPE